MGLVAFFEIVCHAVFAADLVVVRNTGPVQVDEGQIQFLRHRFNGRRPIRYFASEDSFLIRSLKDGKPHCEVKAFPVAGDRDSGAVRNLCRSPFPGAEALLYLGVGECNGMLSHGTAQLHRPGLP